MKKSRRSADSRRIAGTTTSFQLMTERVDGWCWDDIFRQCIPDLSSGNWKGSANDGW